MTRSAGGHSLENAAGGASGNLADPMQAVFDDCRAAFILSLWISLALSLLSVAPILFMMNVYDRVLPANSMITLVSLLVLVMGIYVFWTALEWMRNRLFVRISLRLDWDMAEDVFMACFSKGVRKQDPQVHQVMGDLHLLRQFFTKGPVLAVVDAPFALMYAFIGFLVHPLLAVFIVFAVCVTLCLALLTRKITTGPIEKSSNLNSQASMIAAACVRNADTAQSMAMLPALRSRWYEMHRGYLQHHVNASEANGFIGMFGGIFTKALPSLQLALAAVLASSGMISVGGVIAATFLVTKAIAPFKHLIEKWEELVRARLAYERLTQLLKDYSRNSSKMSLPPPKGNIRAKDLSLIAPDGRVILQNLNFQLPAGQFMAIMGRNGSGKSTLLRALVGVSKPHSGELRLDGAQTVDWNSEELGVHLGYVSQTPDVFDGTVAENIARMGAVDSARVVKAAQQVGIHEMLLSLPHGYDTPLFDCSGLSGGQLQRIKLARAIYGNPVLLVMDEPDGQLDDSGAKDLFALIMKLKSEGTTVVCATHNAALIRQADYALVLDEGCQRAFGKVSDMLGNRGEPEQNASQRANQDGSGTSSGVVVSAASQVVNIRSQVKPDGAQPEGGKSHEA